MKIRNSFTCHYCRLSSENTFKYFGFFLLTKQYKMCSRRSSHEMSLSCLATTAVKGPTNNNQPTLVKNFFLAPAVAFEVWLFSDQGWLFRLGGQRPPTPSGRSPYPAGWLTVAQASPGWLATSAMTSLPGAIGLISCPTFIMPLLAKYVNSWILSDYFKSRWAFGKVEVLNSV